MSEYTFEFEIFYSQIALFKHGLDNPFNDWNEIHVNQGFSWREGSVSFGTLSSDGNCKVIIKLTERIEIDDDIIRAIVVPFKVESAGLEIGSVMETVAIDIPKGKYELLFTAKSINNTEYYAFSFIKSENPKARIVRVDDGLSLPEDLLMVANPAI